MAWPTLTLSGAAVSDTAAAHGSLVAEIAASATTVSVPVTGAAASSERPPSLRAAPSGAPPESSPLPQPRASPVAATSARSVKGRASLIVERAARGLYFPSEALRAAVRRGAGEDVVRQARRVSLGAVEGADVVRGIRLGVGETGNFLGDARTVGSITAGRRHALRGRSAAVAAVAEAAVARRAGRGGDAGHDRIAGRGRGDARCGVGEVARQVLALTPPEVRAHVEAVVADEAGVAAVRVGCRVTRGRRGAGGEVEVDEGNFRRRADATSAGGVVAAGDLVRRAGSRGAGRQGSPARAGLGRARLGRARLPRRLHEARVEARLGHAARVG